MTQTAMIPQEKSKPIDKKALKKAAKKSLAGTGSAIEKANGADNRRERDIAELRQMIGGATTPEEARHIYEQLGKDLIPEEKFQELINRFETETSKQEKSAQQPVGAEPVPPVTVEEPPQKTFEEELGTAIEEAAKATPEEIDAAIPEIEPTEEAEEPAPQVRIKVEGQEYPLQSYEEAPEDEVTVLSRKVVNEEIAKLDQQLQDPALEQFHEQIFRKIETLRKIESSYDPRHELAQALANGEISQESYNKIINIIEPKEKPAVETGRWVRYLKDNMRRLQAERSQRKYDQKEEDRAGAKTRRKQKRERYLEAHPEEREYLEARDILEEEAFEPTPQMEQISAEIKKAEEVAYQKWQNVISHQIIDAKILKSLPELQFSLRRVEFLRHALKVAAAQAHSEWEEKREIAKKLMDRGTKESYFGSIHIEGKLPGITFADKLRKALEKSSPATEKKTIKKTGPSSKPQKNAKSEIQQPTEKRPLNILLKSLRSDIIRGKIKPEEFLEKMGRIRELKQQLIRGKITPQQFSIEIQKL